MPVLRRGTIAPYMYITLAARDKAEQAIMKERRKQLDGLKGADRQQYDFITEVCSNTDGHWFLDIASDNKARGQFVQTTINGVNHLVLKAGKNKQDAMRALDLLDLKPLYGRIITSDPRNPGNLVFTPQATQYILDGAAIHFSDNETAPEIKAIAPIAPIAEIRFPGMPAASTEEQKELPLTFVPHQEGAEPHKGILDKLLDALKRLGKAVRGLFTCCTPAATSPQQVGEGQQQGASQQPAKPQKVLAGPSKDDIQMSTTERKVAAQTQAPDRSPS